VKTKVSLLPKAEEDLQEIIDYIAIDRPMVAAKIISRFESAFERLERNPLIGNRSKESRLRILGYRFLVVSSYIIFYKVQPKFVFIYRILHGARNYSEIL
jgi:toxin ParE1/3/4